MNPQTPSILPADGAERELALLFTDVVDSTRLNERVGDEKARQLWAAHDRAARELLRTWRGREVGRSDGFLLLFERCDDALAFALGYHRALAGLAVPFSARVGMHWGPVALRHNAPADVAAGATPFEVDGLALPTAARVSAAALGRQTLLSGAALQTLPAAALQGLVHCDHGHWRLKGLDAPVDLHELGPADAPLKPPPDSAKAYRVVRRDGLWVAVAALPNNLGTDTDAFVGRDAALQALAQAYDEGSRLVTLLGTGGVGKTRLALRYARGWLGNYPGGAWFCDLAAARSLDGVVQAVAQALDVPLGRSDPVQQLVAALAGRGECLLVLDNFEQVARHADACLGAWLRALPQVRFLVTSREVLGLHGERLQGLTPLSVPEAQQLFRQRMQAAGLGTALLPADAAALPGLVQMLDCLPLAIELAASRARVMPPADQLQRIGERFWLLGGRGSRHDRQATLRATLDWSWDLLDAAEQSALAQLAVFEGGFTLAACEAVLDFSAGPSSTLPLPWVADVLQSLVEKSLVQRLHARRFALLRSVQDYAAERLAALGTAAAARHSRYFAGLSEAQAIADRCVDIDNLVTACRQASAATVDGPAAREALADWAVGALVNAAAALSLTGPFRAGLDLARPLAARSDLTPRQRARVLAVLGAAESQMGDNDLARSHLAQGLALALQTGDRVLQALLMCRLAVLDLLHGQADAAHAQLQAALALAGDVDEVALRVRNALGNLEMNRGRLAQAQAHYDSVFSLARQPGQQRWLGGLHGALGALALMRGDQAGALGHLRTALQMASELGDRQWAGNVHCNLGLLHHELGQAQAARAELTAAAEIGSAIGHRRLEAFALCNLALVDQQAGAADAALLGFQAATALAQAQGDARLEVEFRGYLGEHLCRLRNRAAAQSCFERARHLLQDLGDDYLAAQLACHQALGAVELGDLSGAAAALAHAEQLARSLPADLAGSALARSLASARSAVNCYS